MGKEKLLENTLDRLLNPEKEQFITGFEDLDLAMVGGVRAGFTHHCRWASCYGQNNFVDVYF